MAILLHHHDVPIGRERHDIDPMHTVEDEEIMFLTGARIDEQIGAQLEDAEIAERFGAKFFPRLDHKIISGRPNLVSSR